MNLVAGAGDVGEAIVRDERVDCIAFTGSVHTGKRVAVACAERVARVNLEMGGKDPFIVCSDVADEIAVAAKGGRLGGLPERRSGLHVSRALLRDARRLRRLRARVRRLHADPRAGRPDGPATPTSARWCPHSSATRWSAQVERAVGGGRVAADRRAGHGRRARTLLRPGGDHGCAARDRPPARGDLRARRADRPRSRLDRGDRAGERERATGWAPTVYTRDLEPPSCAACAS